METQSEAPWQTEHIQLKRHDGRLKRHDGRRPPNYAFITTVYDKGTFPILNLQIGRAWGG